MNEDKFTGKADVYASYRPEYPGEMYDCLFSEAGFRAGDSVADVGAGTGIFSAPLAERGCRVFAVEPNADMREAAARNNRDKPGFVPVDGSAEATTLPDHSVAEVTAAQAFHWFDPERFARECRRILVPDGVVAVAYNHRTMDDPVTQATYEVNARHCPAFSGFSGGVSDKIEEIMGSFFRNGEFTVREFRHAVSLTADTFIGRALSSSYAPRRDSEEYGAYIADLRNTFEQYQKDGALAGGLLCRVYWGRMPDGPR